MPDVLIVQGMDELRSALDRFGEEVFEKAVKQTATVAEREALRRFRRTTATWHHKPAFEAVSEFNGTEFTLLIGTDDEIYRYVEEGTRPHEIRPKGNWPLRFQWGGPGSYKAKTTPGNLTSSQGGPSGDWVHFMHVNHPGTEARRFMPEIHREVSKIACETMLDQVQRAIERLLRKR